MVAYASSRRGEWSHRDRRKLTPVRTEMPHLEAVKCVSLLRQHDMRHAVLEQAPRQMPEQVLEQVLVLQHMLVAGMQPAVWQLVGQRKTLPSSPATPHHA